MLEHPLTRGDLGRILTYTPPGVVDALIENNVSEGLVLRHDEQLSLTPAGRAAAAGVVSVQDASVAELWAVAEAPLATVEEIAVPLVRRGRQIAAPASPSTFEIFARVPDRPTPAGRVLRAITAMRYWRADAHRAALDAAGLVARDAHALNRLWDSHRGVSRVGQGFPEPGAKGVAALEAAQLAAGGAITPLGIELREQVELDTDRRTAPLYMGLDASSRDRLRSALFALPPD
jgi:hypothetical protein